MSCTLVWYGNYLFDKIKSTLKHNSEYIITTGVQVGNDLDIYNYMVVYIVVIEVMKNL